MDQDGNSIRFKNMPAIQDIYVDPMGKAYINHSFSIEIYNKDLSELIETWKAYDENIFPKAENKAIRDLTINDKGRIFVVRDNEILVCDKYFKNPDYTWLILVGTVVFIIGGAIVILIYRKMNNDRIIEKNYL